MDIFLSVHKSFHIYYILYINFYRRVFEFYSVHDKERSDGIFVLFFFLQKNKTSSVFFSFLPASTAVPYCMIKENTRNLTYNNSLLSRDFIFCFRFSYFSSFFLLFCERATGTLFIIQQRYTLLHLNILTKKKKEKERKKRKEEKRNAVNHGLNSSGSQTGHIMTHDFIDTVQRVKKTTNGRHTQKSQRA